MPAAIEAATALDPGIFAAASPERSRPPEPNRHGSVTQPCASRAFATSAGPTSRRTTPLNRWTRLGFVDAPPRCRAASPWPCRRGATTSPRRSCWTSLPSLDPARAARAAEGCAAVEGENDLVEEVLRLRGLDAVPPVSLPRAGPGAAGDADAAPAAQRDRPPHAGRCRPDGMRHASASWRAMRLDTSARSPIRCG